MASRVLVIKSRLILASLRSFPFPFFCLLLYYCGLCRAHNWWLVINVWPFPVERDASKRFDVWGESEWNQVAESTNQTTNQTPETSASNVIELLGSKGGNWRSRANTLSRHELVGTKSALPSFSWCDVGCLCRTERKLARCTRQNRSKSATMAIWGSECAKGTPDQIFLGWKWSP